MPDRVLRERVLVVDDDEGIRHLLERILQRAGYRSAAAHDAPAARQQAQRGAFDLILCDVGLPGESGLDLVEDLLSNDEHLAAVMVSGLREVALAEHALGVGASGYVLKPFTEDDVVIAVLSALRHRRARLDASYELKASREETIRRLCMAVESHDPGTGSHIERMSEYCVQIAEALEWDPEQCDTLRLASSMHDIGKIAIADDILLKPGSLTPDERAEMQKHAEIGYRILAGSRSELLQQAATIAWTHHERFDGDGYPRGLEGEGIPIEGRIAAVADVFDALSRDRVYRPRLPRGEVLDILEQGRGSHFDPVVLDTFLAVLP